MAGKKKGDDKLLRYEVVPIDKVIVDDRARVEMGNIEELSSSIKEKGVLQPIRLNSAYRLLAGGRRLAAAQAAGLTDIPAVIRGTSGEIDEKEIELYENVHRKDMTWPERSKLEKRIFELKSEKDPDWSQRDQSKLLDTALGAVNRRLQLADYLDVIPELAQCKTEDEAWKTVKKIEESYVVKALTDQAEKKAKGTKDEPITKWADNHYTLGNALEAMPKMASGIIHFAEVDPPYAIALEDRKARAKTNIGMSKYNEVDPKNYSEFLRTTADEVYRMLYDNAFCIWWFGQEWYATVLAELIEAGFKVNPIPAIWYKGNQGQTASPDTMLGSSYETFFVCRKGQPKLARPGRNNVFVHNPVPPSRKIHPTEKPVELMVEILETFLYPGGYLLSPFLGSGATLRACYRLNHLGFGWDLSAEYKKAFMGRLSEDFLTGIKPKLEKAVGEG